jgi:hypothetical protein
MSSRFKRKIMTVGSTIGELSMSRRTASQTRWLSFGLALLALMGYAAEIVLIGVAIFPGVWLCYLLWAHTAATPMWARILWVCMAGVA